MRFGRVSAKQQTILWCPSKTCGSSGLMTCPKSLGHLFLTFCTTNKITKKFHMITQDKRHNNLYLVRCWTSPVHFRLTFIGKSTEKLRLARGMFGSKNRSYYRSLIHPSHYLGKNVLYIKQTYTHINNLCRTILE